MTSLREEIDETIKDSLAISEMNFSVMITDKILKLVEKRIDSIEEWSNATPKDKVDKAIRRKEIDRKHLESFRAGFEEAIKAMRREMLK